MDKGQIELALLRWNARGGETVGSLFYNPGSKRPASLPGCSHRLLSYKGGCPTSLDTMRI